jgi:hypothetical protein
MKMKIEIICTPEQVGGILIAVPDTAQVATSAVREPICEQPIEYKREAPLKTPQRNLKSTHLDRNIVIITDAGEQYVDSLGRKGPTQYLLKSIMEHSMVYRTGRLSYKGLRKWARARGEFESCPYTSKQLSDAIQTCKHYGYIELIED